MPSIASPAGPRILRWLLQRVAPRLGFLVLLAFGWELMARTLAHPLVPPVEAIGQEILRIANSGLFVRQMAITLLRVAMGFGLAFVAALALGLVVNRRPLAQAFLEPAVLIGLTVPGLVWALLCVIWFGVSTIGPVVAVALSTAPALFLNITQGFKAVDANLVEIARVLRFGRLQMLRCLWLPTLTPFLLSGARLGLSLAWKVIVLVEVFGLSSGVGYQLNNEFSSQNVAGVLAWTLCFALAMALIEYGVLASLERRLTRWRRVAAN